MKLYFIIYLFLLLRFQMRLNRITHKPIYQAFPLNRRSKRWNPIFFALKSVPQGQKLKFAKKFGNSEFCTHICTRIAIVLFFCNQIHLFNKKHSYE
jgi:hypothetical protein